MDTNRAVEDPEHDVECNTHECNHCKKCVPVPWKSKDKACKRPIEGSGSHHIACAQRHLERHCNKAGRASIAHRMIEKKKIKEEHQE